ncbi:poly-A polymerase [Salinivibrio phage CW02]|uniref:Poly-A polymerase n=1 Tax=Salinivibrio phage CW02 TaxID=1161935 RepID=H9D1F7_9CAUD|nr:nucleotidyltransferase [Salinivibrio phage CW02]AFE86199.1 poly-A polymerase [Salinivibrio phage CW02]
MEAPQRVLNYMKMLEIVTGEEVYVAGGAARDLFHGKEPRDYDVFIPKLVSNPAAIASCAIGSGIAHSNFQPKYGEGGADDNFIGVFKSSIFEVVPMEQYGEGNIRRVPGQGRPRKRYDIDLICREVDGDTIEDVVKGFDANFNYYWFGSDGEIKFLDEAIHLTQEVKVFSDVNRRPEYLQRVLRKLGVYNV